MTKKFYNYSIVVLALISIALVILDFSNVINISNPPFNVIDNIILITFRECKIFCVNEKIHTKKEVASVE